MFKFDNPIMVQRTECYDTWHQYLITPDDLSRYMRERLGPDVYKLLEKRIAELEKDADETQAKLDTDLNSYESQLDEQRDVFAEIAELAEGLYQDVQESKRIDRKKIENGLNDLWHKANCML